MHPQQFVIEMIASGRKDELIEMLRDFSDKLHMKKTTEHAVVYGFASIFLLSVMGQLHLLNDVEDLEKDPFLSVWKSLGLFGIDRIEIAKVINSEN